jgi:predicted nucleic acid-binding protein
MPTKAIVVNASPLITLHNSQLVHLLPPLFDSVLVPPAVWQEVTAYKSDIAAKSLPQATWVIRTGSVFHLLSIAIHSLKL